MPAHDVAGQPAGLAPMLAVEFGRKALQHGERPSALELESYLRGTPVGAMALG